MMKSHLQKCALALTMVTCVLAAHTDLRKLKIVWKEEALYIEASVDWTVELVRDRIRRFGWNLEPAEYCLMSGKFPGVDNETNESRILGFAIWTLHENLKISFSYERPGESLSIRMPWDKKDFDLGIVRREITNKWQDMPAHMYVLEEVVARGERVRILPKDSDEKTIHRIAWVLCPLDPLDGSEVVTCRSCPGSSRSILAFKLVKEYYYPRRRRHVITMWKYRRPDCFLKYMYLIEYARMPARSELPADMRDQELEETATHLYGREVLEYLVSEKYLQTIWGVMVGIISARDEENLRVIFPPQLWTC